jgi:hypothetical protein
LGKSQQGLELRNPNLLEYGTKALSGKNKTQMGAMTPGLRPTKKEFCFNAL